MSEVGETPWPLSRHHGAAVRGRRVGVQIGWQFPGDGHLSDFRRAVKGGGGDGRGYCARPVIVPAPDTAPSVVTP